MKFDALTIAAIGFAGWAVYYATRKPAAQLAAQPAQQQRDASLIQWWDLHNSQSLDINSPLNSGSLLTMPNLSLKTFFPG